MHRGEACAGAEVGQNDPAIGGIGPGDAGEFLHQIRERQPMKSIPPHAFRFQPARKRQHSRDAGQVVMKSRIEARHLRQIGTLPAECLDQADLGRQVVRVPRADSLQLGDQFRRNQLRLPKIRPAMHDPMADRGKRLQPDSLFEPAIRCSTARE